MATNFRAYEDDLVVRKYSLDRTERHVRITGVELNKNLGNTESGIFFKACIKKNKLSNVVWSEIEVEEGVAMYMITIGDIALEVSDIDVSKDVYEYFERWYLS